jgi:hypothetical protein
MFYNLSFEEIRSLCRNNIESLELWARRLIHQRLSEAYGADYFNAKDEHDEPLINNVIHKHSEDMKKKNPGRFQRPVDTLFLDQLIDLLCHPKFYQRLFKPALDYSYPQGRDEVKEFLQRLLPARNALAHSNPISIRQAEQVVCYINDFIDGLKQYYKYKGEEQMWNVPTITKFTDSLGNEMYPKNIKPGYRIPNGVFHVGDTYSITVEVDSSFNKDEYSIVWLIQDRNKADNFLNMETFYITFDYSNVSENWSIACTITSNKPWHKKGDHDDWSRLVACVFPPIEVEN